MTRRIDLQGIWQVEGAGKKAPVEIPGDVHSALLAAGEIADPYWGKNELDLQHLHAEDWVFSRSFAVEQELLVAPSLYLHFDSIDTVAEVLVNGEVVGQSDNMFTRVRWRSRSLCRSSQRSTSSVYLCYDKEISLEVIFAAPP